MKKKMKSEKKLNDVKNRILNFKGKIVSFAFQTNYIKVYDSA